MNKEEIMPRTSRVYEQRASESIQEWGQRLAQASEETEAKRDALEKREARIYASWKKQQRAMWEKDPGPPKD
jgi:hypothetical protein